MDKYYFDYSSLSKKDRHKISLSSIIPRPIAWITSINENRSINLAPFSFFTVLSSTLLVVSFSKEDKDKYKDTFVNILREKEAVVNIGNIDSLDLIDKSSKPIAYNESEVELLNLNVKDSSKVRTPYLSEALVSFEVTLDNSIDFKYLDSDELENNVVFLRIQAVHIDKSIFNLEKKYIDFEVLDPVSRLNGTNYGKSIKLAYKRNYT